MIQSQTKNKTSLPYYAHVRKHKCKIASRHIFKKNVISEHKICKANNIFLLTLFLYLLSPYQSNLVTNNSSILRILE